jgi:signal transduction histidine kinase
MWKRIIAPAVVVSLFWLIVGGATTYYLSWQDQELDRVLRENVSSIRSANEMQEVIWQMQSVARRAARHRTRIADQTLSELQARFERSLQAESSANVAEERPLVLQIRESFAEYVTLWRSANARQLGDNDTDELSALVSRITEPCQEFTRLNEQLLQQSSQRRQQLTAWIVGWRIAMLVIGPSLGLLMGLRLASQLHQSITRISVRLKAVAGDLEQEVGRLEITPEAELPAIQQQLDLVADRIRSVMQELSQARREAMRSERLAAVGELAAGVAHELRNPMTSVKLLIQTIQHRWKDSARPETFDVVMEEISRMESTIQGLLDFARPPRLQRARHDLRQIVRRAVNLTEGRARHSGVSLVTHLAEEPVWVNADAEQLHQVCINLLLNGIESMTTGGEFDIHVEADEPAALAYVRFEDSGLGIPNTVLPRLFEPFVTSKDHGNGLGLAVSRRIVSNHAGRLLAENRPGGGAALTVELPLDHVTASRLESHAHAVAGG